jgi:hypothetical protein
MTAFPLVEVLEATPGFEPGIKALQASALPLGDVALGALAGALKNEDRTPSALTAGPSPRRGFYGADDGIRTRDPNLGKVVLYQLSHVRTSKAQVRSLATG